MSGLVTPTNLYQINKKIIDFSTLSKNIVLYNYFDEKEIVDKKKEYFGQADREAYLCFVCFVVTNCL